MTASGQRLLFASVNLASIRAHPLRSGLSGAAIALGVMLVFASLLYDASLTGSFADMTRDLTGTASLEVSSAGGAPLDSSLVDRVRAVAGVRIAAPLLITPTHVRGPDGERQIVAIAFDGELDKLGPSMRQVRTVRPLSESEGIVVTPQLLQETGEAVDGTLRIVVNDIETPLVIEALEQGGVAAELNGGQFIGLPLSIAQRIFDERGQISTILVGTGPSAPSQVDDIERRLQSLLGDSIRVSSPADRVRELDQSSAQVRYAAAFFSALALLISAYLMFTTVTMMVLERRHELAMLLVLGDRRHRVLLRLLAEAALIGVGGIAVGLPLGWAISHLLFGAPRYLQDAYGFRAQAIVPWWTIAAAAGAGLGTALLGALQPVLTLLGLPPVEALRRQPLVDAGRAPRRRTGMLAAGIMLLVVGALGSALAPDLALLLICVLFAGGALAAPAGFDLLLRLFARPLMAPRWRRGQAIMSIVGASLPQGRGRSVATISAAALALAMVVTVGTLTTGVQSTIDRYGSKYTPVDLLATAGDDTYYSIPFDERLVSQASSLPGVAAAYPYRSTFVDWQDHHVLVSGWNVDELQLLNFDFDSGAPASAVDSLRRDGVLVSSSLARREHLVVGQTISVPTAVGGRTRRVAGVVEYWSWPEGAILVGDGAFVRDYRQSSVNAIELRISPGADRAAVARGLRRLAPGLIVQDGGTLRAQIVTGESALFTPFFRIRDVMVVVGVLAVFNTMLIAALQRTAELGVLRAIGAVAAQVAAVFVLEAAAMVVIALVVGVGFGILVYRLSIPLLEAISGLSVPWLITPGPVLVALGAAAMIWAAGSAYPARLASRRDVLDALAHE